MADNAFVKIGTALLKHQVKRLLGDETLEVIGEELADIGGDKLDAWLGEKSTLAEIEKAAQSAQSCFREKVTEDDLQQWMVSLPLGNLPKVVEAIDELPSSPNESKLENALQDSIALNWKKLSPEQVNNAVNSFLSCLRSALLPIEKQTLMVIGRSVLRTEGEVKDVKSTVTRSEEKIDLLIQLVEQRFITGQSASIESLNPEPADFWNLKHPYAMPPNFTGRVDERKILVDWLNKDNENRLFILRALGGFGKSALSWHWLTHDVNSNEWKKVLWWSFYEGDASFEHFIEETLKYLKLNIPQGQRPQVDELLKAMQSQKILLIMDGFERLLRAYSSMNSAYQGDDENEIKEEDSGRDCVNPLADRFLKSLCVLVNIKSKVLMTTRLTPRAVESYGQLLQGAREEEMSALQPAEAVEFFYKQGIKGTYAEIEAACAPYGFHPLSLRLLAGRILKDFENPADIIVAQKLQAQNIFERHLPPVLKFKLTGELEKFTSTELNNMIFEIAKRLDIDSNQVDVLSVSQGSVQVTLELPEDAALRLFTLYLKGDPIIANLFIQKMEFSPTENIGKAQTNTLSKDIENYKNLQAVGELMTTSNVITFISYSHDSLMHEDRTLALSDRLRTDGIDAMIDQYQTAPPQGWQIWMEKQIRDATFVILVCTETYLRRVMKEEASGKGLGILWESAVIYQYIYNAGTINEKFLPIILTNDDAKYIPIPLQSTTYYNIGNPDGYEQLYRRITNQPLTPKSPLGKLKKLKPRKRKSK